MKKVGDYIWEQLSMWDFAPKDCIQGFVSRGDGVGSFSYYLKRVAEVLSETHYRTETVLYNELVPVEVIDEITKRAGGKVIPRKII